jgi:hypothetical protein
MSKYDPLGSYLVRQGAREIRLTFGEIEKLLGFPLPASARKHRPWWANDRAHVMARVWLDAGYVSEQVDMDGEQVVFRATRGRPGGMSEPEQAAFEQPSASELLERYGSKSAAMRFLASQGWSTGAIAKLLDVRYQFVYNVLRQDGTVAPKEDVPETAGPDAGPPFFGRLRGTIRVAPGVDLTEPADPDWGNS